MVEYILFIAAFCAALSVMDIYIKRAVQGNLRESTASIGPQFSAEHSSYTYVLTEKKKTQDTVGFNGTISSQLLPQETYIDANGNGAYDDGETFTDTDGDENCDSWGDLVHRSPYIDRFSDKKVSSGAGYQSSYPLTADADGDGVYDPEDGDAYDDGKEKLFER